MTKKISINKIGKPERCENCATPNSFDERWVCRICDYIDKGDISNEYHKELQQIDKNIQKIHKVLFQLQQSVKRLEKEQRSTEMHEKDRQVIIFSIGISLSLMIIIAAVFAFSTISSGFGYFLLILASITISFTIGVWGWLAIIIAVIIYVLIFGIIGVAMDEVNFLLAFIGLIYVFPAMLGLWLVDEYLV